jgi:SUF system FeS cluster assembly, SufBD
MVHIGKNTRSRIVSKGISAGGSRNAYRGLVSVSRLICIVTVISDLFAGCMISVFSLDPSCTSPGPAIGGV